MVKIGRNDPCPCGSGQKYKRCCLPRDEATAAERAFEARLGGGCHSAIAALGEIDGSRLHLRGLVADPGGGRLLRDEIEGSVEDAEALGVTLAEALLAQGASAILEAAS